MIWVGIDDTDMPDTPGTNQLARRLARVVAERYRCERIVRHQLCSDPSIPCTSKNGSASLWFEPIVEHDQVWLLDRLRSTMRDSFVPGSDPGLCVAEEVGESIREFGQRAQRRIVTQAEARRLAQAALVHLEGLGGTEGGVIGALAAVGLAVTRNDGRVVQWDGCVDELTGVVSLIQLAARGVTVRTMSADIVETGLVDVGKKLRPNCREGEIVLTVFPVKAATHAWLALKLV